VVAYFNRTVTAQPASPPEKQAFYIVHDQIIGHPLSKEIAPPKALSSSYVAKLLQDVLTALSFAHDQGVIHQNLHPDHLIRQHIDGKIFLTHFGTLAKLARSKISPDGTLSSSVPTGIQSYTAPEQLQQKPQPASDLYALGLIAIEALTGKRHHDFTYDPGKGLLWRGELERNNTDISLPLAEFIDRLIRHDWRDRFAHATEALTLLKAQNARDQIANDSRFPTVIAAPGRQLNTSSTPDNTYLPPILQSTTGPKNTGTQPHSIKPANPYLYKIGAGSIAALLALGVGVKAFQWGEYRVSIWPETWQEWRSPAPATYTVASPNSLTPLMEDGSIPLQPAAASAFWKMVADARAENIEIYPLSGYRTPLGTEPAIGQTVTAPKPSGTQRFSPLDYVTGYALDIGGELESADKEISFAQTKTFKWLMENAQSYGFELSSSKSSVMGGTTSEEPWHWRYVGDSQSQQVFGVKDQ
ncbi:MAG: D-alanyl-D-alanine carboxypeptidase family protein, partial [Cyanobacteria bacterium J06598_3]